MQNLGRSTTVPVYSSHETYVAQILTVTAASTSIALGFLTFYFFLRIKRSFRHHLILLLVLTNLVKALGFMLYPIIELTQNRERFALGDAPKPISNTLCLVSGFNVAWGTEASDFTILLFAVHTLLVIFRPRTAPNEIGLYPYRRFVYCCLTGYPSAMASLAFVNGKTAYYALGSACHLPARPIWYRLALSWIPRYLILITIVSVYGVVNLYAKIKFAEFRTRTSEDSSGLLTAFKAKNAPRQKLPDGQGSPASWPSPTSEPKAPSQNPNAKVLLRHSSIRRQLRLMFMYPMIYFLMSIPPFVNHCWLYTDKYTPPFAVNCFAVVCLAAQGAVDCTVFLGQEKPWRFVKKRELLSSGRIWPLRPLVPRDGVEMSWKRKRTVPEEGKVRDESRQWWDQEDYRTDGAAVEGLDSRRL